MRKMKKTSLAMATFMFGASIVAMAGCKKSFADHENALEVYVCSQGTGHEWLEKALEEFGKKPEIQKKYPNYVYKLSYNDESEFGQQQVLSGATSLDLVFASGYSPTTAKNKYKGDQGYLENLTDLYNMKIPDYINGGYEKDENGNELTYYQKLSKGLDVDTDVAMTENGTKQYYYAVHPGAHKYGIVYNKTIIDQYGYKDEATGETILPRTTDELIAFANSLANKKDEKGNKVKPFVYSAETLYWISLYRIFWAQYEGADEYANYFRGYWKNEDDQYELNVNVLDAQGKWEAMKVMENLLDAPKGLVHGESTALDFTMAQSYLINGKGLMQANGSWFSYEMRSLEGQEGMDKEVRMMDDPIISALATGSRVDTGKGIDDQCPSIETDEELSALIGAIRSGATTLSGTYKVPVYPTTADGIATWKEVAYEVTQADYDRIVYANSYYYSGEKCAPILIPSYATAKELAKDFILYTATDEFLAQYIETTDGGVVGCGYNAQEKIPDKYNSFYPLSRDAWSQVKGKKNLLKFFSADFPLVYSGSFGGTSYFPEINFTNPATPAGQSSRDTTESYRKVQLERYTKDNNEEWNLMLRMAGLS